MQIKMSHLRNCGEGEKGMRSIMIWRVLWCVWPLEDESRDCGVGCEKELNYRNEGEEMGCSKGSGRGVWGWIQLSTVNQDSSGVGLRCWLMDEELGERGRDYTFPDPPITWWPQTFVPEEIQEWLFRWTNPLITTFPEYWRSLLSTPEKLTNLCQLTQSLQCPSYMYLSLPQAHLPYSSDLLH